ncbi:MAG: response regulator [Candidatus Staskawiczbacteria bacterium]|nr:response regulator [Candidatus Staskawiczbacteria bacterium]
MKVLIVEDDKDISWVYQEGLKTKNHKIKIAEDGEVAMVLARSFSPEMIFLDLLLPKKDGMTVLAELKADLDLKTIPVIVLSNLSDDENIKKALTLGAADYFVKSQHPIFEIMEKVQQYMV